MIHAQRPRCLTAPSGTPVTLAEAKAHLRVDHSEEDVLISALIGAATEHLDGWSGILGRCLLSQTWAQSFSAFPCGILRLPFPSASSASVVYWAPGATETATLSASLHHLAEDAGGPYLELVSGASWPATEDRPDAVTVSATYGYGAEPGDVPSPLRAAILIAVADLYRYRESASVGAGVVDIPSAVAFANLVAPYRRKSFA